MKANEMVVLSIPVVIIFSVIIIMSFFIGGLLLLKDNHKIRTEKKAFN